MINLKCDLLYCIYCRYCTLVTDKCAWKQMTDLIYARLPCIALVIYRSLLIHIVDIYLPLASLMQLVFF